MRRVSGRPIGRIVGGMQLIRLLQIAAILISLVFLIQRADVVRSAGAAAVAHTVSSDSSKSMSADASQKFAEMSDQFLKGALALTPVSASQAGYHQHFDPKSGKTIELDSEYDDVSLEGYARLRAYYADWRERFRKETPQSSLDPEDAADWQLIDDQIGFNLLELDRIQNYRHHPTVVVEMIGNGIFLPLSQTYAPKDVRLGHVLSRIGQIPRVLDQAKQYLSDADPVFVTTAIQENDGNIDLIQNTVASEIDAGSPLRARYDKVAPPAIAALKDFSRWLRDDLGKRPSRLTWRLGKDLYGEKFKLVMETPIAPGRFSPPLRRN